MLKIVMHSIFVQQNTENTYLPISFVYQVVERRKQIEIEEQEIRRKEKELMSTVKLPAEAEAYKVQTIAEGKRYSLRFSTGSILFTNDTVIAKWYLVYFSWNWVFFYKSIQSRKSAIFWFRFHFAQTWGLDRRIFFFFFILQGLYWPSLVTGRQF